MKDYQIRAIKNYREKHKEELNEKARLRYHDHDEYRKKNALRTALRNEYLRGIKMFFKIDPTIFS